MDNLSRYVSADLLKPLYNGNMRFFLYIGLAFSLVLSFQSVSFAQTIDSLSGIEISINISPELPQANQEVVATVSSSNENVRTATIAWLLDGEVQQQKPGGLEFTFTTGSIGSSQQLSVLVKTLGGAVFTKSVEIKPTQVTILWEGDTFTPSFYQGRSLYTSGSDIRAEALAEFRNDENEPYTSSELIYTWSKNGTVLGSLSGVGANTLVTEGPKFFGNYILSVEVSTPDGIQRGQSAARIETQNPKVVLYEQDPLIGTQYHAAVDGNHIFSESSQIEVQAIPYFVEAQHENDTILSYSWYVNNVEVFGSQENPSILTIQLSGNNDIATSVRITVDHLTHLLQTAKGTFNLVFEGSARNSLFGL